MTLGSRLSRTAEAYPGRVALVFEGRKYAYREVEDKAEGFAAGLASLGIAPGDRVAVLMHNCPEFAVACFGILKAGAVVVPLNTFLTAPELAYILEDSGSKALVLSSAFMEKALELKARVSSLRHLVTSGTKSDGDVPFDGLIIKGGRGSGASEDGGLAAVFYTSGTTGHPKGAALTHSNLLSNAESCAKMFQVSRKDRFLLFLPMFHAFTFLVCLLLPMTLGARVIVLASVKPFSNVVKAVLFGRVTFFVAIPAVYSLLSMKRFPKLVLRLLPLRLCVSGAAPLPGETLARFAENYPFPLLEGYGLTEASPVVSCNPLFGKQKPGSAGLPLPGVQVMIAGDDGMELPKGRVGEIAVKGPNVMQGYLNNDQATREAVRGGWLFTGDMGYIDEEGYIFIVDRKKDLILVHGMNVYPREVEEALYKHPAVKDAAVIGVKDPHHGEIPRAYITLNEGARATEKEIKEYLRDLLASYKVPRHVEFVESLPMSPTGKVLKRELKRTAEKAGHL